MLNKKIAILGGTGLMGGLFATLLSGLGHQVIKIGRSDWDNAANLLANCDLLIVSVPINQTVTMIERVAPLIPATCLLADFTSLKVEPLLAMLANHPGPVIGLHPMFGPTITTTESQVIVHCVGRDAHAAEWLLNDFRKLGFTLKALGAAEHDQAMSFIQGVEHFVTFSLGTFLHHKNQHPDQLLKIASPIYLAKLLLMGRIFDQDPKLYADIIMADKGRIELIAEFATWLQQWVLKLQAGEKELFIAEFSAASKWMGEFTAYAQQVSDEFLNIEQNPAARLNEE